MEEKKELNPNEILDDLMKNHGMYFTNERYRTPTSRYEAWLMASCLSNLIIAKTLERVFEEFKGILKSENIFQNPPESSIIKDNGVQKSDEESPTSNLKRRKRE